MYPPLIVMRTLYYRFVAKVIYPIVPRKTPFIGEYINKVGFGVYFHDNKKRINSVVSNAALSMSKSMLDMVAEIEAKGDPEQVAKAQQLKAHVNKITNLASKMK